MTNHRLRSVALAVWGAVGIGLGAGLLSSGCAGTTRLAVERPYENSLGMKFVALPRRNVLISAYETRVQDFEAFAKATGIRTHGKLYTWINGEGKEYDGYSWRTPGFAQEPTHPVGGVSWKDAQEFCRWLTQKERAAGAIGPDQVYRLPRDEEWSIAVGLTNETGASPADKDSKSKGIYPWGTLWPPPSRAGNYGDRQWYSPTDLKGYDDGYRFTAPVGSFEPNALGIYDLSGNVYEWCEDEYRPGENKRVMRGAAFNSRAQGRLLSAERIYFEPENRAANHGFRCVLTLKN